MTTYNQAIIWLLNRNSTRQREWHEIFKVMKGKSLKPRILYSARPSFRFNEEIKSRPDKHKLGEFHIAIPPLQQMLKGIL